MEAGFTGSGVGTYDPKALPMHKRYDQAWGRLQDLLGTDYEKQYQDLLQQGQFEALRTSTPTKAVGGSVGAVGSRAGGQVAQAGQMSEMQMMQSLAGAKVAARQAADQARVQGVTAATAEIRGIMQQQLDAWVSTQKLGLEAQEAVQNRYTAFFNTISEFMKMAVNSGQINSEGDIQQLGYAVNQHYKKFQNASPEDQLKLSTEVPTWYPEDDTDGGDPAQDPWD